jgi:GcrA cell cycle regulator
MTAWTHEQKLEVGRLAKDGLSASEIAAKFDGKTRNAVIGLAMRNPAIISLKGQSGFQKGPRMPQKTRKKKSQTSAFQSRMHPNMQCDPLPQEAEIDLMDGSHPITLLELTDKNCHWPIGMKDYVFCGRESIEGFQYCSGHCRISYQPRGNR